MRTEELETYELSHIDHGDSAGLLYLLISATKSTAWLCAARMVDGGPQQSRVNASQLGGRQKYAFWRKETASHVTRSTEQFGEGTTGR